ncbi:MAG: cysteine hydrolase family protein [Canibacter sp.]
MAMHNLQSSELLIIDMQHIFADDDSDWQAEGYSAAEANVAALANAWTDRAIWTRFVRDPDEPGAWQEYYERWPAGRLEADDPAWNLTLTPSAGQRVLDAPTFSKWNSQMQSLLEDDTVLVVCGVASDCCVISTVLGAVDAGRKVMLVTDACAGGTRDIHDQSIELMSLFDPMVRPITTQEILAAFTQP